MGGADLNSIIDELTISLLNLGPKSSKEDLEAFKGGVQALLSHIDPSQKNLYTIASSISQSINNILDNQTSIEEGLQVIGEKISLLQKLLEGKEIDEKKLMKDFSELTQEKQEEKGSPTVEDKENASKGEKVAEKEVAITINPEEDLELYQDFINEGREHLSSIEVNIINLEQNPHDLEVINTIFRPFHTIKGIAGFLDLEPINKLAHAAENMLDAARSGELNINEQAIDVILEAVDMLKAMIDDVEAQITSGQPTGKTFPVSALINKIEEIKTGQKAPSSPSKPQEKVEQKKQMPSETSVIEGEELKVNFEEDFDLYQDFINEAREHLSSIELNIINLEQNPHDLEVINSIFRPFHTIKGVSGFLNLEAINKLSHAAENMLDAARSGELNINEQAIDVILEAVDMLKAMIDDLENQITTKQPTGQKFPVQELIKKIEAIYLVEKMKQEAPPPPPKLQKTGEILVEKGVVEEDEVKEALEKQKTTSAKIGEILVKEKKVPAKEVTKAIRSQRAAKTSATIKVDTQKLDSLIDMIGELLITQSMIRQNPVIEGIKDQKLVRDISQLSRITTELQKISMSLRMVPIKETFQKMIRLVRDLSKKSGKKVQLVMQGEETEIDRNMVEELYDPLVHMIRNSVDHGIEMPEERAAKGKPEIGTVELMAYHKGGNIVIEIKDDGRGLDKEKILKKAIERGIIHSGEDLSDQEVYQLIFRPGFSTAEKVTEVSGRGVGMDVVKKALEKLRGKVEIKTEKDKGTTFIIKLPLTLAIIDGIIVKVGNERYILPTIAVQEVFRPNKSQYNTYAEQAEMINVRDNLFPVVRLHKLFNVEPKYTKPWEALMVLVESENERKCLMVDDVLGKQEVVIKSLGEGLGRVKGIAGGAIMGDGKVGLILDVTGIFEMSEA